MKAIVPFFAFALAEMAVSATADLGGTVDRDLIVTVTRADLRPLAGANIQFDGHGHHEAITDDRGRAVFPDIPMTGAVTIVPSRSGFRFEPLQLTVPDATEVPSAFMAIPTATDVALSLQMDDPTPRVGDLVRGVITLRNLGTEAATDIFVSFGSLPGLVLEDRQTEQGTLQARAFDTLWALPQLNPGASAEVRVQFRATQSGASVLVVAVVDEMDQLDTDPLNNSAQLITQPRVAHTHLELAMTIAREAVKAGETIPVALTLRNDGAQDATQIALRTYLPPGSSFLASFDPFHLSSSLAIPRLAAGAQVQLTNEMRVRFAGRFELIAHVTSFEQGLLPGAEWPQARVDFTVEPAFSRLTLMAFTDPPDPRVGEDVDVMYVVRNDGPDTLTGLDLFTREDPRLDFFRFPSIEYPVPPVPGPFVFGDALPAGAWTYVVFRHSVRAAGDLTNYFTVEYQDQLIPDGGDHSEVFVPIKARPAEVGLSLDASPKEITVQAGDPVTLEFPVHNDGPQPAHGIFVDFGSLGLEIADFDEVIHADRVLRPGTAGYIDVIAPGETVRVRKHFVATLPGIYTNVAQVTGSYERPDLLLPLAAESVRLHVLPPPPPDLEISVRVNKPQVNVGEYAIFVVTIVNRAAQPALDVVVYETDASEVDLAFETVRSYGPFGDDRLGSASRRRIPRIDAGARYSMSRTMRIRKPVTIPYVATIAGVNRLIESDLPWWSATTEVTGTQVATDVLPVVWADRTNVNNGDLVNFAIIAGNLSSRVASHTVLDVAQSAGFQVLSPDRGDYGYFFDSARPQDLESSWESLFVLSVIRAREQAF
jgi:hypothetical protein